MIRVDVEHHSSSTQSDERARGAWHCYSHDIELSKIAAVYAGRVAGAAKMGSGLGESSSGRMAKVHGLTITNDMFAFTLL